MKKILIVFGTRPEAIKMAPVVKEFKKHHDSFKVEVCVTAQHREMLDQVLKIFEINPNYDLNLMKSGQDLYDLSSRVLKGMRTILNKSKPDWVFVHGDTTTSSMTALASFYKQIPVAHVEAGLRTNNIYEPWPEEINRQITGRIASIHFAPTESAKQNLILENTNPNKIYVTGNTVIDALFMALNKIEQNEELETEILNYIKEKGYNLRNKNKKSILVTGHRRENFGEGFLNICEALKIIADKHKDFDIIYPVHLNPNVQKPVYSILKNVSNIYLIEPLDYLPFIFLMKNSFLILTDSGGIQEEAPSLGKPVLVMRDTTERPEAVISGTVLLVGTDINLIVKEVSDLIYNFERYQKISSVYNLYGDGFAAKKIVDIFLQHFK